jgi:hypothetical protein
MKFIHLLPIILVLCLVHSWLDFAKAIQEKKGFAKLGKSSLKSAHSVVKKEKQTPIEKSKNPKATKLENDVNKLVKKSHKNHHTKKSTVKPATNSKHLPVAKLGMVQKERCNECCPSISAFKRGTIGQKRENNKRSKRQAYCPYHGYDQDYYCGMCRQNDMFSGADNQYVVEATGGGYSSSGESSASSTHTASSNDNSTASESSYNDDPCEFRNLMYIIGSPPR